MSAAPNHETIDRVREQLREEIRAKLRALQYLIEWAVKKNTPTRSARAFYLGGTALGPNHQGRMVTWFARHVQAMGTK